MNGQLVWLITGCSSGIGEATARAILARGDKVIATARAKKGISGTERLSGLAQAGAAVLELDVNSSETSLIELAKQAWQIYGHVDVLMNNAGYMDITIMEEYNTEHLNSIIRTHVFGPLNLARAFLPLMRTRMSGTILFSGAASRFNDTPGASAYAGSMGLLEGVVQKMAAEVEPFGMRCSILILGHFRTEWLSAENCVWKGERCLPEYEELDDLVEGIIEQGHGTQVGDPEKAAALIVQAVRGEGRCEGLELPLRLPVGPDAFEDVRRYCQELLKVCERWEGVSSETSFLES